MKEYIIAFECPVTESSERIEYQVQQKLVGELIRCKDCRFYEKTSEWTVCKIDEYVWKVVDENGYCSDAERRICYK